MKHKLLSILLILALVLGLAACGGSSGETASANVMAMRESYDEAAPAEAGGVTDAGSGSDATVLPENRKWIITVYLDAETEDLEAALEAVDETITAMDGYVEDQSIYNGSAYSSRRYRNANLTIRIPAEKVDEFTTDVAGIANVVSREKNLEDITLSYVATESRMTALETEEARLLELLEQAENMSDLLEIEERLTDVRYELESVTSQMRLYNNQVEYATVYVDLSEVQEYTPVEEPTLWERIRDGFLDSLKGLKDGAVDLLVWVIVMSPYLVIAAVVIVLLRPLLRKVHLRKKKKE